jgi:hypothetical protein
MVKWCGLVIDIENLSKATDKRKAELVGVNI